MGLFGQIGNGLSGLFGDGFTDRLAIAGALVNGDYGTAAQIGALQAKRRKEAEDESKEKAALQSRYDALVKAGIPDDQAQILASDPSAVSSFLREKNQPKSPYRFEDNSGNQMEIGPDGKSRVLYEDPNPWKFIPNGMGGVVPVNVREYMKGQTGGMPEIGTVMPDPRKQGGQTGLPPSDWFQLPF